MPDVRGEQHHEFGEACVVESVESHLDDDLDAALAMLTGAVLVRVTFEGRPATPALIDDVIERALGSVDPRSRDTSA